MEREFCSAVAGLAEHEIQSIMLSSRIACRSAARTRFLPLADSFLRETLCELARDSDAETTMHGDKLPSMSMAQPFSFSEYRGSMVSFFALYTRYTTFSEEYCIQKRHQLLREAEQLRKHLHRDVVPPPSLPVLSEPLITPTSTPTTTPTTTCAATATASTTQKEKEEEEREEEPGNDNCSPGGGSGSDGGSDGAGDGGSSSMGFTTKRKETAAAVSSFTPLAPPSVAHLDRYDPARAYHSGSLENIRFIPLEFPVTLEYGAAYASRVALATRVRFSDSARAALWDPLSVSVWIPHTGGSRTRALYFPSLLSWYTFYALRDLWTPCRDTPPNVLPL